MTEARWEALIDREAAGESLSAEERAFVADYERAHPECAEERELWQRSLAALGEHRLPDEEALTLISAQALAQHRGEAPAAPPRRRSRARSVSRRVLAIALPALAAAAVLAVYWPSAPDSTASLPTKSLTKDLPDSPLRAAPHDRASTLPEPPRVSPEPVEIHGALALLEGEGEGEGEGEPDQALDHTLALGQLVGPGHALAMPTGRLCLSWSEPLAVVCAEDARMEILDSPVGERRLRLDEGILLADLDPLGPGQRFVVETMLGTVSAVGTVFAVEVRDGRVRALVIQGEVEIADPEPRRLLSGHAFTLRGEVAPEGEEVTALVELRTRAEALEVVARRVGEGSSADAGASSDKIAVRPRGLPSVDALADQAQAAREARDYRETARLYRLLLEHYGGSKEAKYVPVRLGDVLMSLGETEEALAAYEAYLKHPGWAGLLAPEAALGRIGALESLGRHEAALQAAEEFAAHLPNDPRADKLLGNSPQ